jgi:hypothetical protein
MARITLEINAKGEWQLSFGQALLCCSLCTPTIF